MNLIISASLFGWTIKSKFFLIISILLLSDSVRAVIIYGSKKLHPSKIVNTNRDLVGDDCSIPNSLLLDFSKVTADEVLHFSSAFINSLPKAQIQNLLYKTSGLYKSNPLIKFQMTLMATKLEIEEIDSLLVIFTLMEMKNSDYPDNFRPSDILKTAKTIIRLRKSDIGNGHRFGGASVGPQPKYHPFRNVPGIDSPDSSFAADDDDDDDYGCITGWESSTTYSSILSNDEFLFGSEARKSFKQSSRLLQLFESIKPADDEELIRHGISGKREPLTRKNAMPEALFLSTLKGCHFSNEEYRLFMAKNDSDDSDDSLFDDDLIMEYSEDADSGEHSKADLLFGNEGNPKGKEKSHKSGSIPLPPQFKKKVRNDVVIDIAPDDLPTTLGSWGSASANNVSADFNTTGLEQIPQTNSFLAMGGGGSQSIQAGIDSWMDDLLEERETLIRNGRYLPLNEKSSTKKSKTPPIPTSFAVKYFRRNTI